MGGKSRAMELTPSGTPFQDASWEDHSDIIAFFQMLLYDLRPLKDPVPIDSHDI